MCANCNLQLHSHNSVTSLSVMWTLIKLAWIQATQRSRCCPVFSSILLWIKSYVDQCLLAIASHFVSFLENAIVDVNTKHIPEMPNEF